MSDGCHQCGALLAEDQRYCVACGARVQSLRAAQTEADPAPAASDDPVESGNRDQGPAITLRAFGRTGILRPPRRGAAAVLATGMLASGTLIGVAIGPVAIGSSAASAAQQIIAVIGGGLGPSPAKASSTQADNSSSGSGGTTDFSTSSSSPPAAVKTAARTTTASVLSSSSGTGVVDTSGSGTGSGTGSSTTTAPKKVNLKGVVVSSLQSFDIADGKGNLVEVHPAVDATGVTTTTPPAVGTKVKLATTKLANGTLTEARLVKVKAPSRTSVSVTGVVSFVDATDGRYTLSSRGVSLMIAVGSAPPPVSSICPAARTTTPPTTPTPTTSTPTTTTPTLPSPVSTLAGLLSAAVPAVVAASSTPSMPGVGQRLEVNLSLPPASAVGNTAVVGELSRKVLGVAKPPLELAGLVSAVDKTKRTVTLSADGAGITTCKITLTVPASIALKALKSSPPEAVVAHATVRSDGTYTLTGAAPDDDAAAAGSVALAVGDFKPAKHSKRRAASDHRRRPKR